MEPATIHKYDPDYKDKVHLVVETIDHELCERKQFSVADVNRYLDIDCHRYLRLLGRVGFLRKIPPKPGLEAHALSLTPLGGAPERFKVIGGRLGQFEQLGQQLLGLGEIHA